MKKIILIVSLFQLTIAHSQNLTGNNLSLSVDPGSDQAQSFTPLSLINRGYNGAAYRWTLYTAAIGGGYGVRPNAFEVWEYPPYNPNFNCCVQRLSISPSNYSQSDPVVIDSHGGIALGGYYDSGNNFLSVKGSVGIGTTDTQGYALGVNGTIHSQAVKVDMTGWSDYVFKPAYNLSSLENVKTYIDKNHHLPDMPSEKEVVKNGLDLGEMVKLQQKKIEELTLYLIEKDKSNKKNTTQIRKQQAQINTLNQKIENLIKHL